MWSYDHPFIHEYIKHQYFINLFADAVSVQYHARHTSLPVPKKLCVLAHLRSIHIKVTCYKKMKLVSQKSKMMLELLSYKIKYSITQQTLLKPCGHKAALSDYTHQGSSYYGTVGSSAPVLFKILGAQAFFFKDFMYFLSSNIF